MAQVAGQRSWSVALYLPDDRLVTIEVQKVDAIGRPRMHAIRAAGRMHAPAARAGRGSGSDAVGAWPENGNLGTQLGPNRNGASSS